MEFMFENQDIHICCMYQRLRPSLQLPINEIRSILRKQ